MKYVLTVLALGAAVFLGGWFASGRDFRSFRDGLTSDFRQAGAAVLDEKDVRQLDARLEVAVKKAKSGSDRIVYRKLEIYAVNAAKAINEIESATQALAAGKPEIAQMQLREGELRNHIRHACVAELNQYLPSEPPRALPSASDIGDAKCEER